MKVGNFGHKLAEHRAEQEREAGLSAARAALKAEGQLTCKRCGDEIEPDRRQAMPSARRCVDCQTAFEKERKGRRR